MGLVFKDLILKQIDLNIDSAERLKLDSQKLRNILPLVTISVPVFNAEAYLTETLESIRKQTYRNIEVLCIDDYSTDRSSVLIKQFCEIDSRFVYLLREGNVSGEAATRNTVLNHARGIYLASCDADDLMMPDMIYKLLTEALDNDCEIVYCGKKVFYEETKESKIDHISKNITRVGKPLTKKQYMPVLFDVPPQAWSKLIKLNSKLNGLRYKTDIKVGTDFCYNIELLCLAEKISYIDEPLYCYRVRKDSLSAQTDVRRVSQALMHQEIYNVLLKYKYLNVVSNSYLNFFAINAEQNLNVLTGSYKEMYRQKIYEILSAGDHFFKFKRNSQKTEVLLRFFYGIVYRLIPGGQTPLRKSLRLKYKIHRFYGLIKSHYK